MDRSLSSILMYKCYRRVFLLGVITLTLLQVGCCFQRSTATFTRSTLSSSSSSLCATRQNENEFSYSTTTSMHSTYLATCVPGLAHILQRELEEMRTKISRPGDIVDISLSGNAAVTFEATRDASLYALCWLRSAHRLLELVATTGHTATDSRFDVDRESLLYTRHDIHDFVRDQVNVKDLLGDGKGGLLTLSVKAILNNPRKLPKDLSHSHYTALSIKNSLCDVARDLRGDRPDVDTENPDVPLVAILRGISDDNDNEDAASLSLFRSLHPPGSLHKRGYRQGSAIHKAAMKESMAAGLLIDAGWKDKVETAITNHKKEEQQHQLKFIDPMAGSGSLALEACMMATDIAPGLMRIRCGIPGHSKPPVTRWKSSSNDIDDDVAAAWKNVLFEATQRAKAGIHLMRQNPSLIRIEANDIHPSAVDIMKSALSLAGVLNFVCISNEDCYNLEASDTDDDNDNVKYFVATNPPWGVRLTEDIAESWEGLRHFIRDKCPSGTQVYVLSGDKDATASLKLRRDRMIPLQTGDQNLRWIQYTIGGARAIRGKDERQRQTDKSNLKSNKSENVNINTTKGKGRATVASTPVDSWI